MLGHFGHRLMAVGADHDHVDVLAEHAAEIGQALAGAEADVVAQEQAAAAQVDHAGLEADAVRSDGFSNSSAITRPGSSGSRSPRQYLVFRSSVIAKMRSISTAVRSARACQAGVASMIAPRSRSASPNPPAA